jgi:hypothetical protein
MHTPRSYLVASLALALPLATMALTNKDVIKMQKAGLTDETILLSIQREPADYDTSTDALIELKSSGLSEKVIQQMITSRFSAKPASDVNSHASDSTPSPAFMQDFPSIAPTLIAPVVGQDYFTRYTFHEEKDEHITTNYSRGAVVPINTLVKLRSMSGSKLVLKRADNGQSITVKNEEQYTKKSIAEVARLMLSADKTPLEKLPDEVATAVRVGEMHKGMTKELVLMARGYPPAHETPSTDGDRWVYWSSRFVKMTILFSNGRLSEGRGIN